MKMPSPVLLLSFYFVFLSIFIQTHTITAVKSHTLCAPFNCGNFTNITYPFWNLQSQASFCGHPKFKVDCQHGNLTLNMNSQRFVIIEINQTSQLLRIARLDLYDAGNIHPCPLQYTNVDIDMNFFNYTSKDEKYTLLSDCSSLPFDPSLSSKLSEIYTCSKDGNSHFSYLVLNSNVVHFKAIECKKSTSVPGLNTSFTSITNTDTLEKGFEVGWRGVGQETCDGCKKSGERCGFNISENAVICLSPKNSVAPSAPVAPTSSNGAWNLKRKLTVAAVCAVLATFAVITAIYFYWHRSSAEQHQYLGISRFTCGELDRATNNFHESKRLGFGASATVYKGVLHDGRHVAVKRFEEYQHNTESLFVAEVQRLAKLVHPNIVAICGCTSLSSRPRMLVYEYVINGDLEDHLRRQLPWNVRMNIAVETASALSYIHACNIIHRDIKPRNILLNADMRVKLGDFGLARLSPNDQSHVSTVPRGTPGYEDPEYTKTYRLTKKSDIYSFGVVLVQLITSLRAVDHTRGDDDANLAMMAVNRIRNQALGTIVDHTLGFDSDPKIREMIIGVADLAVQCLEDSKDRPSMKEVFERLQAIQSVGDVELLIYDPPPQSADSNSVSYYSAQNTTV